jgi:hypothetical protein
MKRTSDCGWKTVRKRFVRSFLSVGAYRYRLSRFGFGVASGANGPNQVDDGPGAEVGGLRLGIAASSS